MARTKQTAKRFPGVKAPKKLGSNSASKAGTQAVAPKKTHKFRPGTLALR